MFAPTTTLAIGPVFSAIPYAVRREYASLLFDFNKEQSSVQRLIRGTIQSLRAYGDDTAQAREFAKPHLLAPLTDSSIENFARALVDTQLSRLTRWRSTLGPAGRPLLDDSPFSEFVYWTALGMTELPYEVIITNQLMASAEYAENSVHSALRGGLSNGLTTGSIHAQHGTVSILSLYPFIATDPATMALRDGAFTNQAEMVGAAAALLTHEIGHQLLHLGHPFGNSACIMSPVQLLHFKAWMRGFAPARCAVGSAPAMRPGAHQFIDLRRLPAKPDAGLGR